MNINRITSSPSAFWNEVDQLFNRTLLSSPRGSGAGRFLVRESDSGWTLRTDLPGFRKEDVEVAVEDGHLRVAATGNDETTSFVAPFTQRVRLSPKIDTARISARLENGVLEIELPREESSPESNIRIEVN